MSKLTPSEIKMAKANVKLSENTIILSDDDVYNRDFIRYIEDFCFKHGIDTKIVGESLVVYPSDFDDINPTRFNISEAYVSLLAWEELSNCGYNDDETNIIDLYWIDVEVEISSYEQLESFLLKVRDTKLHPEVYYTQEEITERNLKRDEAKRISSISPAQHKINFLTKLESLGITENEFNEAATLRKHFKD